MVRLPAGGWYRLELRARRGDQIVVMGEMEPVGVGELFVIAGQSYAVGANDELTNVEDRSGGAGSLRRRRQELASGKRSTAKCR